ncbi:MAG TPA: hypothetical protein VFQ21_04825 [Gemmatimonadota bacterium]|nr:hypothetical protein [Gemmatimonadota bacterium]
MPWTMKRLIPLFAALLLLGCAEEATEEVADEAADTTAVEEISLADLAGTWNMRTTSTDPADTFVNEYQVVIGETSWTLNFPGRDPVSATAVVDGDNIITDSEPFESVRMPGTMVTTHTVFHLEGDRLVGDVTATWQMEAGDSVGQLRTEGTRAP